MRGLIKPLQEPDELLLMSLVFFCTCHAMHSNVQIESVACRIQTTYICEVKCLFYFSSFLALWWLWLDAGAFQVEALTSDATVL